MRSVVLVVGVLASRAAAEPRLEASGFVGVGVFAGDTQLGNSWAPEQVPRSAPVVGGRLGWVALPALGRWRGHDLQLAIETELSIATSFTGDSGERMAYFAPVFGWRAHAALRLTGTRAIPQLVAGAGGETVASTSPFMAKETDPVAYGGAAIAVPLAHRWLARADVRYGVMAARGDGLSSTLEVQLGLVATFGLPARAAARPQPVREPIAATVDDTDSDGDGIPDRLDLCPTERETVNGVDDGDGCAELDPDGDGVIGATDRCPDQPEDFDRYEDDDGCPELDNEGDGIADARDTCPLEPETRNGFDDDDGCPDVVPADVTGALAAGARVAFEPGRARVTAAAKAALQPVLAVLAARPALRLAITARAESAKPQAQDLAKRRAEAIKWFLVDSGVAGDRLDTAAGEPGTPLIGLALAIAAH